MAKDKLAEEQTEGTEVVVEEQTGKAKKAKKIKVTVKEIPVLHNGEDFQPGEIYEIEEKHFNESLFEKIDQE
ncbi:hypothetical protein [Peribacillus muralis]|uniref:hypothetical protein n=1 Tax=Peribacillus muralis TaxID=264697 RepID=UPI003D02CE05